MKREQKEKLRELTRKKSGGGAAIKRALLVMSIPATAVMAVACYGAPMANTAETAPQHIEGADCNGDGIVDVQTMDQCSDFAP